MQTKVIAIEFTLTAGSAQSLWNVAFTRGGFAPKSEGSRRFRVVVPKCERDGGSVETFYERHNEVLDETSWERIGKEGVAIGGFTVWHRVAVILAFQILMRKLTSLPLVVEGGVLEASGIKIHELATGALMVALEEV